MELEVNKQQPTETWSSNRFPDFYNASDFIPSLVVPFLEYHKADSTNLHSPLLHSKQGSLTKLLTQVNVESSELSLVNLNLGEKWGINTLNNNYWYRETKQNPYFPVWEDGLVETSQWRIVWH